MDMPSLERETIVDNLPIAVVGLDQRFRITLWNRRAEALFGYQPSEAFGRDLSFLVGAADYERLKRRVDADGALRQEETRGYTRDGRALELSLSLTGQLGAGGAREWSVVIQDETEKKRLQEKLIQAEKLSVAGSLIAGVAHELNNPLSAVTGFAELLETLPLNSVEREDLRLLQQSALRCKDIVHGLLSFVRQGPSPRQRLGLNAVAQATLGLLEYRLVRTEGIALEIDLDPRAPLVAGDFSRLQQVAVNLLGNAADALRGRAGRRVIRVRTRVLSDGSELEVEDNGPGLAPVVRESLFQPFVTTKPRGAGSGLGLSISTQIAAEFGAVLRHEDGPEGGARFVVRFPACPAGLEEPEAAATLPPACRGASVLVLDDEPDLAQLMARIVSDDGLIATTTTSIEEARTALRAHAFDLVIADVDLGAAKGFDLRDSIEAGAPLPPFLFVTGDVLDQSLRRAAAARGAPLLSKPFLRKDFLRAVRRLLPGPVSA
jgi:two-component system NtrC family sensor kinase